MPLSEIGESVTYGEAILLIRALRRQSGSQMHMVAYGLTETASLADLATILHAQKDLNRDLPRSRKPVTLPFPWEQPKPNADVTPARRAELEAQLARRSAFAG